MDNVGGGDNKLPVLCSPDVLAGRIKISTVFACLYLEQPALNSYLSKFIKSIIIPLQSPVNTNTTTMANPSATPSSIHEGMERLDIKSITDPSATPFSYLVTAFLLAVVVYSLQGPRFPKNIKHLNPKGPLEFSDTRPKKEFVYGSRQMLANWFKANPNKPCRVISDFGEAIVLPPRMANEIKNDDRLSFTRWTYKVSYPLRSVVR